MGEETREERSVGEAGKLGRACFVDVETTGLSPEVDELIELALVLFEFDRDSGEIVNIVEEYQGQREPNVGISPGAARVHGITPELVRGKQVDEGQIQALIDEAEFLIAHNASFDREFLSKLVLVAAAKDWACSMRDIDWYGRGFRSRGLQQLLWDHDLVPEQAHRAAADVKAALALLSQTDEQGRPYFQELLERRAARGETVLRAGASRTPADSAPDEQQEAASGSQTVPTAQSGCGKGGSCVLTGLVTVGGFLLLLSLFDALLGS